MPTKCLQNGPDKLVLGLVFVGALQRRRSVPVDLKDFLEGFLGLGLQIGDIRPGGEALIQVVIGEEAPVVGRGVKEGWGRHKERGVAKERR
jgi:hypothetical protein